MVLIVVLTVFKSPEYRVYGAELVPHGRGHSLACQHQLPSALGSVGVFWDRVLPGSQRGRSSVWGPPSPNPPGMPISPKAAWQQTLIAERVFPSQPLCLGCLQGEEIVLLEVPLFPPGRAVSGVQQSVRAAALGMRCPSAAALWGRARAGLAPAVPAGRSWVLVVAQPSRSVV